MTTIGRSNVAPSRFFLSLCSLCLCGWLTGCDAGGSEYRKVAAENVELKAKINLLEKELTAVRQERAELKAQRDTLAKIEGSRVEAIPKVTRVDIGAYTGGYNLAGGKGHDSVKVYIIPFDAAGSAIKAPGSVTIKLFDLAAAKGQEQVGQCELSPPQLEKQWFSGAFTFYHYSVVCPLAKIPEHRDITVRLEFVDYVTGKTFSAVKTVQIDTPSKLATTQKS